MEEKLMVDLVYVAAFCAGGLFFAMAPFAAVHLLSARRTRAYAHKTEQFVECGMEPIGDAWIRYCAAYYLYALVFVAFAVDVLYLIPVALVYDRVFPIRDLVEVGIFIGMLSLVILYAWKKGVFEWKRKAPITDPVTTPGPAPVPSRDPAPTAVPDPCAPAPVRS